MANIEDDLTFCKDELRKLNSIHHFMALSVSETHRQDLIAFYAFMAEIARIPRLVSEPGTGEIRLQWWIDVIQDETCDRDRGCGGANIGPIASALKHVQRHYGLSADSLIKMVEARKFDLYHDPMPDRATFEAYAGETRSLPLLLSAQILNDGVVPNIPDLCGNAGVAISLSNHVRRWAKVASYQQLFLPKSAFDANNVALTQIFSRTPSEQLTQTLKQLLASMMERHNLAMEAYGQLTEQGLGYLSPLFLELSLVPLVLKRRQADLYGEISIPNWRSYWAIWRMAAKS